MIVTDVNDNPPRFLNSPYKFELNSQDATEIGRVAAKDDDLGSGGVVKFRLLKQTEVRDFEIIALIHFYTWTLLVDLIVFVRLGVIK